MKSYKTFQTAFLMIFLSAFWFSLYAQDPDYPISTHELIVGDTTILRQESGYCNPDKIEAMLSPYNIYWPEYCPGCMPDTFFSFRTEPVPDLDTAFYFYFILPMGTLSGGYDVFYMCDGSLMPHYGPIMVYTPPFIWIQPQDTTVCAGDNATFSVNATGNKNEDLIYEWYHNESLISNAFESELIIESAGSSDTGRYYCVISNGYGIDTTEIVRLDLYPFPGNPGTPAGPDRLCPNVESTTYTIHSDPLATGYEWHLEPMAAGDTSFKDTVCSIRWDPAFSGIASLHVELVSGYCGKNTSDTLEITVPGISAAPEICIVGIDEQTGKYRIVWERSAYGLAQQYKIYRESNQADVYLEIGTVDTSKISFFVDSSSAPDVLSHRYKISYMDSCGSESEMSPYHQTMHLVANIGTSGEVNLIWSGYAGIPFPTYTIYRGSHPDSMSIFSQVPSTVTSYKDLEPPIGHVFYQISMSNPMGCDPAKKSESDYSSSMSNMDQVHVTGINTVNESMPFRIFPNPVTDILQIQYPNAMGRPVQYIIYNSLGVITLEGKMQGSLASVKMSSLSPGIYVLQLTTDIETYSTRFIINRK